MPNNPYDDLLKHLIKLLEQVTSLEHNIEKIQDGPGKRPGIFGCAIITGGIPCLTGVNNGDARRSSGIGYEMVDAGETAYVTVPLPPGLTESPEVMLRERECHIHASGMSGTIELNFPIIPQDSSWSFRNGLLDITLVKTMCEEEIPVEPYAADENEPGTSRES